MGFKLSYEKQKFDRMERGEHHKPMHSFVRKEELSEHHFMHSDKKKGISKW